MEGKHLLFPCVLLVTSFLSKCSVSALVTGNVLTNEIIDTPYEEEEVLPLCRTGSACGLLQVNAFGLHKKHLCRCPRHSSECPMDWDPQDGHSVTMGSEQYKYCGPSPSLHLCQRNDAAYIISFLFEKSTFEQNGIIYKLHCLCPEPRGIVMQGSSSDSTEKEIIIRTVHTCAPLPICEERMPCKVVSVGPEGPLVNYKCHCPRALVCPTITPLMVPSQETENFANGNAYSIYCQPWF